MAQGRHIPEQPGFLASLRKGTSSLATGIAKTPANLKALRLGTVVPSIAVLAALAGSTPPALA
ncbi:MAG: peptidoglycan endopeptidase, partial [Parascardovia denticolens]